MIFYTEQSSDVSISKAAASARAMARRFNGDRNVSPGMPAFVTLGVSIPPGLLVAADEVIE
jgi:hypothetical protein